MTIPKGTARTALAILVIIILQPRKNALLNSAELPAIPPASGVPKPGATNDSPYAPEPILPGGVILPLYPPDSSLLKQDRVRESEQYNLSKSVPGRINSIVNIHNPSIEVHTVEGGMNTGAAVILAAGGGHNTLNVGSESADFVPYFYNYGVNTVILRYRLRRDGYNVTTNAVHDAFQAIRLVRAHAKDWNIDPNKIGIIGFSAGAELASPATIFFEDFDRQNNDPTDPLAGISSRPDFVGLIYPGPTPFARGENPPIPRNAPPAFILCGGSGDRVHAIWADEYFSAMLHAGIPNVEMHIYGNGRHPGEALSDGARMNAGLGNRNLPFGSWQDRFIDWFRDLGFLQRPGVETKAARDISTFLTQPPPDKASANRRASMSAPDDWPWYGHDAGGMRYSPLTGINRDNVSQLKIAWVFHTGDISDGKGNRKRSGFETTPLMVDGTLFLTTPFNRVIALDPETGHQRWAYDPKTELTWNFGDGLINRGVATWVDTAKPVGTHGRRRIFEATLDARLIAVDADTGKPCEDFGQKGHVSLRDVPRYIRGQYHVTSPPAVIDDLVVVGSAIDDNSKVDMPSGVVRAFDARTGALRWSWDPIPPNTAADSSGRIWRTGAANAWSIMAVDPDRHLLFVPTGSASPDYYGGLRPGDNKWANSVVALHSKTGELAWGFQLVHHDLWDYDCASPPLLATLPRNGQQVPVVIQGNKTGMLYVLNRETGAPVFPIEERPVPQSDVPGEMTAPTQPFPVAPPPLVPHNFAISEAWAVNDIERQACLARLQALRNEGIFTPPSLRGSLVVPGNVGGLNWSGYAFDPRRNLLVANVNSLPAKVRLLRRAEFTDGKQRIEPGEYTEQDGCPYGLFRNFLQADSNLPCCPPPWGMLTAVDLAEGKIRWQIPLGDMATLGKNNVTVPPGSISLGGPIITAGGLIFIAGTLDPFIRGFDIETGKELWKAQLPTSGGATPMTYQTTAGGKQYLVIAAGGHAKVVEESQSDAVVAFALP